MATVEDVLRDALGHLGVIDAGEAIEADDARDGIYALNNMMRRWEASGIALGWSDVTAVSEEVPLPPEALETVGANLAVRLRSKYQVAIAPDVMQMATDGLALLRRDVRIASPVEYVGCGRDYDTYTDSYR